MLWVWIIIAIIIIALIIWFLLRGRSSKGTSTEGQGQAGRHASDDSRADSGGAGSGATADDTSDRALGAGGHESPSGTVHTTTNYGSAADPTPDSASALPADEPFENGAADSSGHAGDASGPDAPTSAMPLVSQDRRGEEGSALPADGSNEFDDVHDAVDTAHSPTGESAGSDDKIAEQNDDPTPRRADPSAETSAEAARHSDNEIHGTQVQHPTSGTITPGGAESSTGDDAAHVWSDGHDPERATGSLDGSAGDAGASASGKDPMTERFGDGAASSEPDGSGPAGYPIKGNSDSMLFHTEDSPRYVATSAEVWFRDEAAATSAGFAHWDRDKRGNAPVDAPGSEAAVSGTSYTTGTRGAETAVTGVTGTSEQPAEPDPMQDQVGAGAASPREGGSAPSDRHIIKGDADSMLFHTEDSPHYVWIEAEVWFTDEEAAKAAGFKHWDHLKR